MKDKIQQKRKRDDETTSSTGRSKLSKPRTTPAEWLKPLKATTNPAIQTNKRETTPTAPAPWLSETTTRRPHWPRQQPSQRQLYTTAAAAETTSTAPAPRLSETTTKGPLGHRQQSSQRLLNNTAAAAETTSEAPAPWLSETTMRRPPGPRQQANKLVKPSSKVSTTAAAPTPTVNLQTIMKKLKQTTIPVQPVQRNIPDRTEPEKIEMPPPPPPAMMVLTPPMVTGKPLPKPPPTVKENTPSIEVELTHKSPSLNTPQLVETSLCSNPPHPPPTTPHSWPSPGSTPPSLPSHYTPPPQPSSPANCRNQPSPTMKPSLPQSLRAKPPPIPSTRTSPPPPSSPGTCRSPPLSNTPTMPSFPPPTMSSSLPSQRKYLKKKSIMDYMNRKTSSLGPTTTPSLPPSTSPPPSQYHPLSMKVQASSGENSENSCEKKNIPNIPIFEAADARGCSNKLGCTNDAAGKVNQKEDDIGNVSDAMKKNTNKNDDKVNKTEEYDTKEDTNEKVNTKNIKTNVKKEYKVNKTINKNKNESPRPVLKSITKNKKDKKPAKKLEVNVKKISEFFMLKNDREDFSKIKNPAPKPAKQESNESPEPLSEVRMGGGGGRKLLGEKILKTEGTTSLNLSSGKKGGLSLDRCKQ